MKLPHGNLEKREVYMYNIRKNLKNTDLRMPIYRRISTSSLDIEQNARSNFVIQN